MPYPDDRRSGRERRTVDVGPPRGVKERRRGADRRGLSISEVEISPEEWERYFAGKAAAPESAAAR